ncbi:MAG: DUF1800 family protein [Phycisphaerales bacterium]
MLERPLDTLREDDFDYWKAHHLLGRAGFGGTPAEVRAFADLGLEGAIDRLLQFEDAPDMNDEPGLDADIMRPRSPEENRQYRQARQRGDEAFLTKARMERQSRQRADRRQLQSLRQWWITRLINTRRPLQEKMTLFWHGHFATGHRAIEDSWDLYQQNRLFRQFAFGNFKDLTHRIIRDPAMLKYLNNDRNVRRQPNENLARELMELFTLGEGNGYGESDIKEGARALTGYHFRDDSFVFREAVHDPRDKRILGREGTFDGDDFVDLIFDRPYAAEFLTLKLYRFFVHDLPGDDMRPDQRAYLKQLSSRFRASGYDVGMLLRTMFRSQHFYDPANVSARIKSPVELHVGTIRQLGTPPRSPRTAVEALRGMGQDLFEPPSVRGWPGGRTWINTSTLFLRQNLALHLITGRRPKAYAWPGDRTPYDPTSLLAPLRDATGGSTDANAAATYLLRHTLGTVPHPSRVATITTFFEERGTRLDADVLSGALALITAMPEYQLC